MSLTESKAREILTWTCADLKLPEPSLQWTDTRHGFYMHPGPTYPPGCIVMGPYTRGIPTLVHELAHHHDRLVNGNRLQHKWTESGRQNAKHHKESFTNSLIAVATSYYGDPLKYPWYQEYKSLQPIARVIATGRAIGMFQPIAAECRGPR